MEPDPGTRRLKEWALAQLPIPVVIYDHEARVAGANEAMIRTLGRSEDEMIGLRGRDIYNGPEMEKYERLLEEVRRTGEGTRYEEHGRAPAGGREHAWSMLLFPLKDQAGRVQGMSSAPLDFTEQYRARAQLALVNEASIRIGSTLDVTRTAQEFADVATNQFADFVGVDLLDTVFHGAEPIAGPVTGPVVLRRVAHQSVLAGCPESAVQPGETDSYPGYSLPARTLATGRASRHAIDDSDIRGWMADFPARARAVRAYGMHSIMAAPLRARDTTLGVALFVRHRTEDPFDDDDLILAEEITARAAVCLDNARRYTRERTTALTLQHAMLPRRMPEQGALDVAYRYLPADSEAGVGGDWFDVIPLSGARVALVVGDVVGHGVHASATMGRLRAAVRTLADIDLPPDELLTRLDDLVIRLDLEEGPASRDPDAHAAGEIGATCLYAVYDPVSARATLARAGHPAPAVVSPDGAVTFIDLPAGPPLGLGGLPFESADLDLAEGSLLALFTDGLIEAADRDVDRGLALLARALTRPAESLEDTCDLVLATLLKRRPTDDTALLLARTRTLDAQHVATWDIPADPAVVATARKEVSELLTRWGLDEAAYITELVVSELVTNAIRYGELPIELRLIRDSSLICEVSDASNTAPHLRRARVFDEGGRGLLLVAQLTQRWGTRHTPTGKTIWAEQPLPSAHGGDPEPPA
jgi:PAS domain S-box-containing protein